MESKLKMPVFLILCLIVLIPTISSCSAKRHLKKLEPYGKLQFGPPEEIPDSVVIDSVTYYNNFDSAATRRMQEQAINENIDEIPEDLKEIFPGVSFFKFSMMLQEREVVMASYKETDFVFCKYYNKIYYEIWGTKIKKYETRIRALLYAFLGFEKEIGEITITKGEYKISQHPYFGFNYKVDVKIDRETYTLYLLFLDNEFKQVVIFRENELLIFDNPYTVFGDKDYIQ